MAINPYPINPDPEATEFYNNPNPNAEYDYFQSHDPKNKYDTSHLKYEFITSIAYIKAKQLFESGPQSDVWLAKLDQLVSSLNMPSGNFWSDVGNTFGNTYSNRFTEMLNNAFVSLNNLTNEWFEWFNKLPKEQRSQFEDAGINVALDGGSMLTGSQTSPQGIAPSPDFQEQQNKSFDNVVNFVTSTAGGLLDLVGLANNVFALHQQKRSIDIQENNTLSAINLQRVSLGLKPLAKLSSAKSPIVQDEDYMSAFGIKSSNVAEADSKKSRIALETEVNPLYDAVDDATRLGIGPYNEIMSELGNIQLGYQLYNMIYQSEKQAYDRKQLSIDSKVQQAFGEQIATGDAMTTLAEQSFKQTDFRVSGKLKELGEQLYDYKKQMLSDWIEKANSDSPDAFIYSSLLMKSGLLLDTFMGPAEIGLDYINKGSDILDDLIGIVNPLGWFKVLKKGKAKSKK